MDSALKPSAFRQLLIPLDGTEMAEAVVPSAARLAATANANVTLLHVIEHHAPVAVHGRHHLTGRDEAGEYLQSVMHRYFEPDMTVNWHVHEHEIRDVADSVSRHAWEFRPDLIVLCAHDHEGWWRWVWGSVGQKVLQHAHTPVLLFRWRDGLSPEFPFHRLLIPLDGDPQHESGLAPAAEIARLAKASIDLVQVVPTLETLSGADAATGSYIPAATRAVLDLAQEQAAEYLARHVQALRESGAEATATVLRGDPFAEINTHVKHAGNDLVVLGTHGKIGTGAFWAGSLGQRLLDCLPATFLLAPAQE